MEVLHFTMETANQREGHPGAAPDFASMQNQVRAAAAGFFDGTSICRRRTRALPVRAPSGFPPPPRRGTGAPLNSKSARFLRARAKAKDHNPKHERYRLRALIPRLPPRRTVKTEASPGS